MPISLHTDKIKDEKSAFINELYDTIIKKDFLINGEYSGQALRIHKLYLCLYIMNHYNAVQFKSQYYEYLISSIIESESLFLLGLRNAAMMTLRTALELSFKFLYYEYHPIELELNEKDQFDLRAVEYREFLYSMPIFNHQEIINKVKIEQLWKGLCQYTHYDRKAIDSISVISEITSIFNSKAIFQNCSDRIKDVMQVICVIFFIINPNWLQTTEKSYFDYPFEILFSGEEIAELKIKLRIV